jgi:Txe/YoeB family toxin of Txe-Axe toxin-antitoxin module
MDKKDFNFEDLNIWKEGMRLSVSIYKLMKNCKDFGFNGHYLAKELEYLNQDDYKTMLEQSKSLSAKIQNFIKTRKTPTKQWNSHLHPFLFRLFVPSCFSCLRAL